MARAAEKTESSLKESKKHADTKYGVKQFFEPNFNPIRKRELRSWKKEKVPNLKKGGKVKRKNTSRENRLEELGRVDAEKARTKRGKRNLKSEKKRIVRELHSHGGSAGAVMSGKKVGIQIR